MPYIINDVTDLVEFHGNDDECLPITKCVCGKRFEPWKFFISIYKDDPYACPSCGRKMYFSAAIKVFEVLSNG